MRFATVYGRVGVRAPVGRADQMATLVVSDSGCGIAAADLPHIRSCSYCLTQRARATPVAAASAWLSWTTSSGARRTRVDVTSLPEDGSTFSVFLPLAAG